MSEQTVVIENLPADFDDVRLKLDFHFRNKKKSGGEIIRISEHPDDKRKALLFYPDDSGVKNVLERVHQIEFGDLGLVEVIVKVPGDEKAQEKKVKPVPLPRLKCEPIQTTADQEPTTDSLASKNSNTDVIVYAEEDIAVRSMEEVEFIESCMNLAEIPEIKKHGVTIVACGTESSPYLKVTAAKENIREVVKVIKRQLSFMLVKKHSYSKAGESKVLKKNEANAKAKAKELHCRLYLLTDQPKKCGPTKSFTHKINSYITLTVTEGDLHQHTVDALICPMTSNLLFDNPTSRQLLKAGGFQIQEVCRRLQREQQSLLAGDVIISEPGNLLAKTLIYAVLPKSDQSLSSYYLQSAIISSLQKAEERNSASVAMPVVGCGTFGFSVEESCSAIMEAIQQFCTDHQNTPKNMKNIFVLDSDVKKVEEFSTFIAQPVVPIVRRSSYPTSPTSPFQLSAPKPKSGTSVIVHGVIVSLKKGDITKEMVDVIVNSNSRDLNLNVGVSQAIFKAAGRSVVDEYKSRSLRLDEVILTSGGNLSCKHIAQMFGPANVAEITTSIEKVLKLCESKMAATVAIPAIGTGGGGISAHESIKAIFNGLDNHLIHLSSSWLKEINVVAFDPKIWEAYLEYFKKRNRKVHLLPRGKSTNQVIKSVGIEVKKGDITRETVQAIVNTTNITMDFKKGVSGAIFKAAGPSVGKECKKIGALQSDTVAVTSAGKLQCDFIIHMMGPHSVAEVRLRVKKVLEQCEQKKISTISFPAVGTGGGRVKSAEAIEAMLQGFEDYFSQRSFTAVKSIHIVINQDNILQEFQQGLKEWIANNQETEDNNVYDEENDLSRDEDASDPTRQTVINDIVKEKQKQQNRNRKLKKDDIGSPINVRHIGHVGWDPIRGFAMEFLDPVLRQLFDMCGITDEQLQDKETSKVIYDFIEEKGGVEAIKSEFIREVSTQPKQTLPSPAKQPITLETEISAVSFPITTVEVYGTSAAELDKVENFLHDLISDECTSKEIQSCYLADLPEAEKKAIIDLSQKNQVHILMSSPDKLTVSGKKDDVLDTVLNINSFIQAAKEREIQKNEEKRIRDTLYWEVAVGDTWEPLNSTISYQLEVAFHKKEQITTYENEGETYSVDFKEMKQVSSKGTSCRIKRTLRGDSDTAIIQTPPTWTTMELRDMDIVALTPDSEEHKKIENEFLRSSQHPELQPFQVLQIRRIQNKGLWQRYAVLKQEVDKKYPTRINEQFLYHGTTKDICQKINMNGFNRSFCGRNAVLHGEGTYFAKDAFYSCQDKYSNPDESGLKYIYRARVVTGLPCKSRQGMKEPDPLDPNDPRAGLYNCAVDKLQDPSIFVVFCDAGAYPDYLIIFKKI